MGENDEIIAAILTAGMLARDGASERGAVERYRVVLGELRGSAEPAQFSTASLVRREEPEETAPMSTEDARTAIYDHITKSERLPD